VRHGALGPVVTHSGGLPGYGSDMRWLPRRRLAVAALADATYAPMWDFCAALLDAVADPEATTRTEVDASQLGCAAQRLASWLDGSGPDPFSENVALDATFDGACDFGELRSALGAGVTVAAVEPEVATRGIVRLAGAAGSAGVRIELTPEASPRIQRVTISSSSAPGR
jgi:serine-type D-Ala-D-Ala carboxypeptidase/endopeptidase